MNSNSKNKSKYIFVHINNNEVKEKIILFFNDLFNLEYYKIIDNTYIYKLIKDEEYELEDIIASLNVDFGAGINVFESNYISDEKDMKVLLDLYLRNMKYLYTNISKLVLDLVNNLSDLYLLRKIVLNCIDNDNDLKNIIIAMYKNNLNVSKTASAVYMHRNTVNNKLEIIKKNTSLDIQKFYDAMAMYVLLYAKCEA